MRPRRRSASGPNGASHQAQAAGDAGVDGIVAAASAAGISPVRLATALVLMSARRAADGEDIEAPRQALVAEEEVLMRDRLGARVLLLGPVAPQHRVVQALLGPQRHQAPGAERVKAQDAVEGLALLVEDLHVAV